MLSLLVYLLFTIYVINQFNGNPNPNISFQLLLDRLFLVCEICCFRSMDTVFRDKMLKPDSFCQCWYNVSFVYHNKIYVICG